MHVTFDPASPICVMYSTYMFAYVSNDVLTMLVILDLFVIEEHWE